MWLTRSWEEDGAEGEEGEEGKERVAARDKDDVAVKEGWEAEDVGARVLV